MSVIQLHSNIKKITSDSTPNSLDLPDGNLAFGIIDGKPRMYANVDNQIFQFPVPASTSIPIGGTIIWWGPQTTIPRGYKLCNGQSLNKKDYPKLYAILGDTYGSTQTTFNLPDIQGRVVVYPDGSTEFKALGKIYGEKTHTLTVDELPSHSHSLKNSDAMIWANTYNIEGDQGYTAGNTTAGTRSYRWGNIDIRTNNEGSGIQHNNIQPSICGYYIIKVQEDIATEDVISLDNEVTQLRNTIQQLQNTITNLQSQINTMNTTVTKLDNNLGDLTIEVIDEW